MNSQYQRAFETMLTEAAMILWFLTNWASQLALLLFAAWFLNGLRKAILKPRVSYVAHSDLKKRGTLLTVKRQELLPPWRTLEETWLLDGVEGYRRATRESDGKHIANHHNYPNLYGSSELAEQMHALLKVKLARDAETEELMREAERAN